VADWWQWAALVGVASLLLAVDFAVLRPRTLRGAALASAWWAAAGVGFAGVVWAWKGPEPANEYLAGYTIERSLSLDNVFVFVVVLQAFAVPVQARRRAVAWAIAAALALRGVFIVAGAALLGAAEWTAYLFAAFLVLAGLELGRRAPAGLQPKPAWRRRGAATRSLRPVLLVLAATDVAFAADSIPSIFAVTRDAEIVFAANAMALVGLPSLYVLLEGMRDRFVHLNLGLAAVLVLTGIEMATAELYHPPAWATLAAVAVLIGASVLASLRCTGGSAPPARELPRRSHADLV
jgi:predicted tellurium resistance membrane protein TerC